MKTIIHLILLFFALSLSPNVMADELVDMEKMADQLKRVSNKISRGDFEDEDLAAWTKLTIKMKSTASLCVSNNEVALLDLKAVIDGLGEKVKGEDADVTKKRAKFEKEKEELDKALAKCNLFVVSSTEVANQISEAEKYYFKQKYLVKSSNMLELVITYLKNPVEIFKESWQFVFSRSGIEMAEAHEIVISLSAIILSVLLAIWLRKKILALESKRQWQDDFTENFFRAFLTTIANALPYLVGAAVAVIADVIFTPEVEEPLFVNQLAIGLLVFFSATTAINMLLAPYPPAKLFLDITPFIAERLARRLKVLAILGLIGYLAFYTVFSESIIESNLLLLRNIFSLFFVLNLVWTLQVLIASPRLPKLRYITMLVIAAVIVTLIAEWMGYRNLAFSSRRIIVLTFVTFIAFIGIAKLFRDLFNDIDNGTYAWCRKIHKVLGVDKNEKVPGLIWLRLTMTILVWGVFAVLIINAWDYSGGVIEQVRSYLIHGFDIGDTRVVPSRIMWGFLIFGAVIILSSWVRSQMENNWLRMTTMGQGARDAVVTITGYIMFLIALLSGMSIAGFDFSNIAIIAGALSVGIGFGLQGIVNNFVSGLVLLFERPVRKGDWVQVGTTEGVVKDIQIRSTRIQTFDRSDVIVPNSELISNQVTNWVLADRSGRAILPVGVAYGSDTEKVRDVLLAIAEEHDNVIKSGAFPDPVVLFREFGESSLNFELRVFLRDINSRLTVVSELNFAIDKAFREAGIEIPFPQRDLHVKSVPENFMPKKDNK